jgi:hypothetical protein
MDITAQLAQERGIPGPTAAYIARFPDDDASVANASALHKQIGLNGWWPTLAKHFLAHGATWSEIITTLGLDQGNEVDERDEQIERLTGDKKRRSVSSTPRLTRSRGYATKTKSCGSRSQPRRRVDVDGSRLPM